MAARWLILADDLTGAADCAIAFGRRGRPTAVTWGGIAVITPDQIPAWVEALPRQRSLSAGRRHHLLARIHGGVVIEGGRQTQ